MTTGEKLIQDLGLQKFDTIKITRSLDSPIPTYVVITDSRKFPITNHRVWKYPGKFQLYPGNKLPNKSSWTPIIDLQNFNPSSLRGRLFFVVDLAGSNVINKNMYEAKENKPFGCIIYDRIYNLFEYTVSDFKKQGVSDLTKKHYKIRQKAGNTGVTLESLIWDETEDSLLLQFFVIPTFENKIKTVDFKGNFSEDNHYETEVMFENASQYLGTREEFLYLSNGEQINKIREMVKEADVRLYSNSPVFYWQGHAETAAENGYNIYDFIGTKGTGKWQARHGDKKLELSKHLIGTLDIVSFISDDIAKMIREEK